MSTKILLCWFVALAIYCWAQGLPLSVVWISRKTPLDKNWFFLCKCLPTRDSILVRDESFSLSPSRCWDSVYSGPVQALCILSQSLWAHISSSPVRSERYCILGGPSTSYPISTTSYVLFLEPRGEGVGGDIPFMTESSKVSTLCTLVCWGSLRSFPSIAEETSVRTAEWETELCVGAHSNRNQLGVPWEGAPRLRKC